MLRMTAELFGEKDTRHDVYLNGDRIGGVYVYQGELGAYINACDVFEFKVKHFACITDAVKWLVLMYVLHNVTQ